MSAQQARERKKAYMNDLEAKVKDLETKNSELEERLSTLQNENQMLRQVCFHSKFIFPQFSINQNVIEFPLSCIGFHMSCLGQRVLLLAVIYL